MAKKQVETGPGPILCDVTVAGRTILEPFCVLRDLERVILGMPALHELGFEASLAGVDLVPTQPEDRVRQTAPAGGCRIRTLDAVEIPARSERVVLARTGTGMDGRQVMVTPHDVAGGLPSSLMVARAVVIPVASRVLVRVCNTSDQPLSIRANQHVAEAQEVEVLENTATVEGDDELPEHLLGLWHSACEQGELNDQVAEQLKSLLKKYSKLFACSDADLGRTTLVQHDIDTGMSPPIRQPPRRVPGGQLVEFEAEIDRMLRAGVIEPGQSPWASPVVLVRKKDGSVRFCVDYRRLNAATCFDAYPLPRIDETLEALGGTRYFSTLDLISGYWQVGLTEEARKKSAFITRNGLFLWNVMPFGLCNAPATFERLMETVLRGLQWRQCLVYLDDVIVFAKTEDEMMERLDTVFGRLLATGLKLKPRKCALFARQTEYLGHVVSEKGIHVNPEKIGAVSDWPVPQNKKEVRSFLGTASYYRRFVDRFATIASPLHQVASPKSEWEWTAEHQRAFEELMVALSTAPVLAFPVPDAPYILDTDASLTGVGAVLSQEVDGKEMVLGYYSESLSMEERNYCVTRRELLAVIKALRHFHCYVFRRRFTIRTDHSSLKWLLNFKEPRDQMARWLEELSTYANQYTIEHRPGVKHGNADGLSRIPCRQCKREDCDSAVEAPRAGSERLQEADRVRAIQLQSMWTCDYMAREQEADKDIGPVREALLANKKPTKNEAATWSRASRRYLQDWDRLELRDGVVWRKWFDEKGNVTGHQFLTPRTLRGEVLNYAHDHRLAGHFGVRRTTDRVRPLFYWKGISDDVDYWLRSCETCNSRRAPPKRPHHALERQVVGAPNQRVAMDILGPFEPVADSGNKHLLVITDYLTKWVEAVPMPDKTAARCADIFVREWVLRYGAPEEIMTDQGAQFESEIFQETCRLLAMEKLRTTAFHPQGDGQTERANRSLLALLNKLPIDTPRNWDVRLPFALAAYRSSVHSTTRMTPNRLMLGYEVNTPLTLLVPRPPDAPNLPPYCQELHERFQDAYRVAVEKTRAQHRRAQPYYDSKSKMYRFKVGDRVWLYTPKSTKGASRKMTKDCWTGWWTVTVVVTACVYVVKYRDTRTTRTVPIDRLMPYVTRNFDRFPPLIWIWTNSPVRFRKRK
jgi:transposase InsO family protein